MDSSYNATVGSVIRNGQWVVSSSNDYRAVQIRSLLDSVNIGGRDAVLWSNDLVVNLRTIWESIRRRGTSQPWIPLVWNKFHIPSCSFISWLACRNRLSTKDRMIDIALAVDPVCCLCRSSAESVEHLFSSCPYTYLLLRACPFAITLYWNDWLSGNFFIDNLTVFEKQLAYLYITVVIYLVWRERNSRVHDNGSMTVDNLHRLIKQMYREKLFSCPLFRRKLSDSPHLSHILY